MGETVVLERTADVVKESTSHLERARELAPLIRSEAADAERLGHLTEPVVEGLTEAGLFSMVVPRSLGGGGLTNAEVAAVLEEISRADGSTGWALMATAYGSGILAGFLPASGAERLFGGDVKAIIAGMGAPVGTARKVDGGYIVSGKYRFGSGTHHASYIAGGAMVRNDQGEVQGAVQFVVPREQVTFLGGWDVTGFVATGSQDYEVAEQFVPDDLTINPAGVAVHQIAPFTTSAIIGIYAHAGVPLGLASRALEEVAKSAKGRRRTGYPVPVDEYPVFLSEFAKIEADYQSARAFVMSSFAAVDEQAERDGGPDVRLLQQARLATTYAHEMLDRVVTKARLWSGSDAFRAPSPFDRIVRDAGVVTQHLFVDPNTYVEAIPAILADYQRKA